MVDHLRSGGLLDGDQVVERDHLSGVGTHVELAQVARRHARGLLGLHINAICPVVEIEIVHIRRAHEDAQRGADLAERHAQGLRLLAVDRDQQLRIVRRVAGIEVDEFLVLPAGSDDLVGDAIEIGQRIAAQVLQFKLESAKVAHALNGGRLEDRDHAPGNPEELGRETLAKISAAEWPLPFFMRWSTDIRGTKISP